ncbi:hypothetical protein [Thomasclavelia cocleata]|uniref:hypothetical protein n=1 Tax=Thomasclavelia cocleata TaxID=69824 RepID=UPI0025A956CB|nr:hypothetical protein [Thomasclavelia cocleata]
MYFKTIYDINNFPDTILKDEINNLIVLIKTKDGINYSIYDRLYNKIDAGIIKIRQVSINILLNHIKNVMSINLNLGTFLWTDMSVSFLENKLDLKNYLDYRMIYTKTIINTSIYEKNYVSGIYKGELLYGDESEKMYFSAEQAKSIIENNFLDKLQIIDEIKKVENIKESIILDNKKVKYLDDIYKTYEVFTVIMFLSEAAFITEIAAFDEIFSNGLKKVSLEKNIYALISAKKPNDFIIFAENKNGKLISLTKQKADYYIKKLTERGMKIYGTENSNY